MIPSKQESFLTTVDTLEIVCVARTQNTLVFPTDSFNPLGVGIEEDLEYRSTVSFRLCGGTSTNR